MQKKYKEMYIPIGIINEKKNWKLMKHQKTGYLYIEKRLERYDYSLYAYLQENPHPNIIKILECYEEDNTLWVIEEYVQGLNLEELLEEKGTLDEHQTIHIILSLCQALMHLHTLEKPIIHRDIKLANIMIDKYLNVTLADFDVSRFYKEQMNTDTTILGTEGYAAPEQFGFSQTDARSDIYSLGIVMNYLLTSLHPKEFIYDGELGVIIQKCTYFDPSGRYQDMKNLHHDIQHYNFKLQRKKTTPFWVLPGFRSKKPWKMGVAVLGYLFCMFMIIENSSQYTNPTMRRIDNGIYSIMVIGILFLWTNYMNVQSHLDLFDSAKKSVRISGYLVYTLVIMFVCAFCVLILGQIFT